MVWLVALVTFGAGGGALLPVVAALLVRTRHPGLRKEHEEKKQKSLLLKIYIYQIVWLLNIIHKKIPQNALHLLEIIYLYTLTYTW